MRRFVVWLDRNVPGEKPYEEHIEMPDEATDEECAAACKDCLDTIIGNLLDTGWNEIDQNGNER